MAQEGVVFQQINQCFTKSPVVRSELEQYEDAVTRRHGKERQRLCACPDETRQAMIRCAEMTSRVYRYESLSHNLAVRTQRSFAKAVRRAELAAVRH